MDKHLVDVAFIPARYGSVRVPGKNIKVLNGIPLIAYSIHSAINSGLFSEVIVSTDSPEIAQIAIDWGARVPALRPSEYSGSHSTDLEWLTHAVEQLISCPKEQIDCIAILRPTNPLRTKSTIKDAMEKFKKNIWADSLRAMEITQIHPGKMWRVNSAMEASPYLDQSEEVVPTHNRPTQSLEQLWIQNASLEITRLSSLLAFNSISGKKVLAYEMPEFEGLDLNTHLDWKLLEALIRENPELIPHLTQPARSN
jgi:CMP-N,N'-diacetyllegionaminic acid synthase